MSPTQKRDIYQACALIAFSYGLLGLLWIMGSEWVSVNYFPEGERVVLAHRLNGLAFVSLTGIALFFALASLYSRLSRSTQHAKASELKVIDLFERHPTPMVVYDIESLQVLAINKATENRYGYQEASAVGKSILLFTHPDDREKRAGCLRRPLNRGGFDNTGRWRHITGRGETLYVQVAATTITYGGRKAILTTEIDITADVRANAELKQQESRFRQLHDSLSDALWLLSHDLRKMIYVSPTGARMMGLPDPAAKASPIQWLRAVDAKDRKTALAGVRQMVGNGGSACEYRVRCADGVSRWVLVRMRRILNSDGSVAMYGGIIQDISESRAARLAMANLNETLERRVAERTSELQVANAELDSFSRTVAHDLKSPLNGIIGLSEMLLAKHKDDRELAKMLSMMASSGKSMAALVDDLLSLSRVNLTEVRRIEVDMAKLAEHVINELRSTSTQREVQFSIKRPLLVMADPGLVVSLLQNLLGNAWKYSSLNPKAHIEIGCTENDDGDAVYFVRDNGVGFPTELASRLFEPFQRLHTSKEFTGNGVGLATCKRIARRHGGDIWVESFPDVGSTFYFTLGESVVRAPRESRPGSDGSEAEAAR